MDQNCNNFLNVMLDNNFKPCITETTRIINSNKPSLVDNIFINTFPNTLCGNILEHVSHLRAYGVVVSIFDFHCSDWGSNPGGGSEIS